MKLLNSQLTGVENLAIDEALVDHAHADETFGEVIRLWEPTEPMVVIGRSSPLAQEVNLSRCQQDGVSVYRRSSGGQSIVTGPGCLMYAVLLDYRKRPELRLLDAAHQFVMERMLAAVKSTRFFTDDSKQTEELKLEGVCDLTYRGRKYSGNALRCKRQAMIYHGTMICDFDTSLISKYLGTPKREPDYRNSRSHDEFVTQLPVSVSELGRAILSEWDVNQMIGMVPTSLQSIIDSLVNDRYSSEAWLHKIP